MMPKDVYPHITIAVILLTDTQSHTHMKGAIFSVRWIFCHFPIISSTYYY